MKKILFSIIAISVGFSCQRPGNEGSVDEVIERGNLEEIVAKRDQVAKSHDSVGKVLSKLEEAIADLDSTLQYPLVTAYAVKDTTFTSHISIQGSVKTSENVLIYPEYQGVLTHLYVRQGERVNKGQVIAKIDEGGLSSQLAQLEAQYKLAKTTFERQERLWEQNIGSEIQYLQAKTSMEAAESAVKQQRALLEKTTVRAPFSGVVDEVITEQGQVVAPVGAAIVRLVNLSNMYVEASVPENYLNSITKGSLVTVRFPAVNLNTKGKVRSVGNYINPGNRTFQIEVDIPNPDRKIKPNLMANLELTSYSNEEATIIPANAIQESAIGETYVYVLAEDETSGKGRQKGNETARAVRTQIKTGHRSGGYIEVLSGLSSGDTIVWEGALVLRDGLTVAVKENNK